MSSNERRGARSFRPAGPFGPRDTSPARSRNEEEEVVVGCRALDGSAATNSSSISLKRAACSQNIRCPPRTRTSPATDSLRQDAERNRPEHRCQVQLSKSRPPSEFGVLRGWGVEDSNLWPLACRARTGRPAASVEVAQSTPDQRRCSTEVQARPDLSGRVCCQIDCQTGPPRRGHRSATEPAHGPRPYAEVMSCTGDGQTRLRGHAAKSHGRWYRGAFRLSTVRASPSRRRIHP